MRKPWYGSSTRIGILGGGQLGRMFIQEAINYDVHVHVLDPDSDAPCRSIAYEFTQGSLTDYDTVIQFGKNKDILTVEIEHVNIDALDSLEKMNVSVFPQPSVLRIIQDKGLQKMFYNQHELPTAEFRLIESSKELKNHVDFFPLVQKKRRGGYDGKGVQVLKSIEDLHLAFDEPSVLEKWIPFDKELSVIVSRNSNGEVRVYPTVECEFNQEVNLVEFLFSPAAISVDTENQAQQLAISIVQKLQLVGILAVEFFLMKDGKLLINEIAPRPHNSGHFTIECCVTSQFEQHLRAILNLPLGSTKLLQSGVMINLLGETGFEGNVVYDGLEKILSKEDVYVHLYGKAKTKPFRKMGHITIAGNCIHALRLKASDIKKAIRVIS